MNAKRIGTSFDLAKLELRSLSTVQDFCLVTKLQEKIFGFDQTEVVPRLMRAVSKTGGQILGAFFGGKLVGFVFALAAFDRTKNERFLLSHIVGVDPDYQNQGIGYALKFFQRKLALEDGISNIRWTFDPLIAPNAYFNLAKLGAEAVKFCANEYGIMRSEFYQNMPSDRLEVHWDILHEASPQAFPKDAPKVIELEKQTPVLREDILSADVPAVAVPIPTSHLKLRELSPELALLWYEVIRTAFTSLFSRGYRGTSFRLESGDDISSYLFVRNPGTHLP